MNVQSAANSKSAVSPRVESPLTVVLTTLEVAQADTANLLNALTENLAPVLTPESPTKEDGAGRAPGLSDVHEQLLRRLDQQGRINSFIRTLIDRSTV